MLVPTAVGILESNRGAGMKTGEDTVFGTWLVPADPWNVVLTCPTNVPSHPKQTIGSTPQSVTGTSTIEVPRQRILSSDHVFGPLGVDPRRVGAPEVSAKTETRPRTRIRSAANAALSHRTRSSTVPRIAIAGPQFALTLKSTNIGARVVSNSPRLDCQNPKPIRGTISFETVSVFGRVNTPSPAAGIVPTQCTDRRLVVDRFEPIDDEFGFVAKRPITRASPFAGECFFQCRVVGF